MKLINVDFSQSASQTAIWKNHIGGKNLTDVKNRKINIRTHFQTIVDDPTHVVCLTCSSKLSTYSLKSLKKHLSSQKHLKLFIK